MQTSSGKSQLVFDFLVAQHVIEVEVDDEGWVVDSYTPSYTPYGKALCRLAFAEKVQADLTPDFQPLVSLVTVLDAFRFARYDYSLALIISRDWTPSIVSEDVAV